MESKSARKRKQKLGNGSRKRIAQAADCSIDNGRPYKKRKMAKAPRKHKHNPTTRVCNEFHDNGHNLSNCVPPYKVLRSLIDPSCPILYFQEYVKRRCPMALSRTSRRGGDDSLVSEIVQGLQQEYEFFLKSHQHEKMKNEVRNRRGRKRRRNSGHCQNEHKETRKNPSSNVSALERKLGSKLDCRLLARTIIIPLCPDLISKVSLPTHFTSDTTQDNSVQKESKGGKKDRELSKCNGQLINWYKKAKRKDTFLNQCEPLAALVDGVISSLVERRERSKRKLRTKTKSSYNTIYGHADHARNMLAEGYRYSSGREASTIHFVGNMNPGVQCMYPNFCASYARSSSMMKTMHKLLGDELTREILLHSVVLIPTGKWETKCGNENMSVENGNYFQLCGPTGMKFPAKMVWNDKMLSDKRALKSSLHSTAQKLLSHTITHKKNRCDNSRRRLNSARRIDSDTHTLEIKSLARHKILYSESFTKSIGYPLSHILNRAGKNSTSKERDLLENIFNIRLSKKKLMHKRWIRESGMEMCAAILKSHMRCDYARLFERYCPIPTLNLMGEPSSKLLSELVTSSYTKHGQVHSFLSAVLKRIFPQSIWGSERNFETVLKTLKWFICMRKEEHFPWKYATLNIRVLDMKWLFHKKTMSGKHAKNDHVAATNLMNHFFRWFYNVIIIPLIRCSFYVTETEFTGKKLLYYRKPVWSKIKSISTKQLLERQYKRIPSSEASKRLSSQQMGCSTLRLLPKMTGIRPVVNLCAKQSIGFVDSGGNIRAKKMKIGSETKKLSTNWMLRDTKEILDFERRRNPSLLGAGVFGADDFYHRLCDFVVNLKRSYNDMLPKLYFASVDISKCYDNIRTDYLFDKIIVDIMKEEEYLIRRHSILHSLHGNNMFRRKVISEVDMPGNHKKFYTTADRLADRYADSISMEGVTCSVAGKQKLLDGLFEHLSSHVLVSSRKNSIQFLLQTNGIPQGR